MKTVVRKIIAVSAYYLGIDALFYWLNRKAKRIITFHHVLPDEYFRFDLPNGVSNSESEFRKIINAICKRYKFSTDLWDVNTCTITFDDGYLNQYEVAAKVLAEKSIPAFLFVAGDLINSTEPLYVDKLLHWVQDKYGKDALKTWTNEFWPRFLRGDKINFDYDALVAKMDKNYYSIRMTGVSEQQLDDLRNRGWKIGWHTRSHRPLSSMHEDVVRHELNSPMEYRSVCLSYPFGNKVEVGGLAPIVAKEFGYPCAVANTNAEPITLYSLPRMSLSADELLIDFELSGFKYFLKYGKLLPKV